MLGTLECCKQEVLANAEHLIFCCLFQARDTTPEKMCMVQLGLVTMSALGRATSSMQNAPLLPFSSTQHNPAKMHVVQLRQHWLAYLLLTMKAVRRATSSMLTPIDANTTMAIRRLRLLGDLDVVWNVLAEVVFNAALLVAVT